MAISAIAIQSSIVKPQSVQVDKDEALFIFKASQSLSEYPYDWEGVGRYVKTALFELTTFKDNRLLMLPHSVGTFCEWWEATADGFIDRLARVEPRLSG